MEDEKDDAGDGEDDGGDATDEPAWGDAEDRQNGIDGEGDLPAAGEREESGEDEEDDSDGSGESATELRLAGVDEIEDGGRDVEDERRDEVAQDKGCESEAANDSDWNEDCEQR